jgi:hypothetical protein
MRCAPLAVHNRSLELYEARQVASVARAKARGRNIKAARAKCAAIQAEIDAINASAHTWPESRATMSYGVAAPCGKRVSHYMSLIDGVWVRHG